MTEPVIRRSSCMRRTYRPLRTVCACVLATLFTQPVWVDAEWNRHTIDSGSHGADGVRLMDANGDGRLDIVTPWEEGGSVRLCLNPGVDRCENRWPVVTIANVASPEDAMFLDLDGDLILDVVTCCEGATRDVYVHWAPSEMKQVGSTAAWTTKAIPVTTGRQMWMFAAAIDVDGKDGRDLCIGGKGSDAFVGWLQVPADARNVSSFKLHPIRDVGWLMSLVPRDMDDDGDSDIVVSDRKGAARGVFWLENPRPNRDPTSAEWTEHPIGGQQDEVMFLDVSDLDTDGRTDILAATRNGRILVYSRDMATRGGWREVSIRNPFGVSFGKSVRVGDIDLDGIPDIVHSANTESQRLTPGVAWMKRQGSKLADAWKAIDVSGNDGRKFDLVQLVDIDADTDLDIVTCEERDGLGVIWYENPVR